MSFIEALQNIPVFSLNKREKRKIYAPMMNGLVRYHYKRCNAYKKMIDLLGYDLSIEYNLEDNTPLIVDIYRDKGLTKELYDMAQVTEIRLNNH